MLNSNIRHCESNRNSRAVWAIKPIFNIKLLKMLPLFVGLRKHIDNNATNDVSDKLGRVYIMTLRRWLCDVAYDARRI